MKLASVYGHVQNTRRLEVWEGWPLPKCNIGLEWEFENGPYIRDVVSRRKDNRYLQTHDDGSLRDGGVEFTTTGDGLFGYDLLDAIYYMKDRIDESLKTHGVRGLPVCNYRTGFHVHLDIRDLEEKEIHNLLLLYCLLEKPIFNFVGKDRWKSNFSVPWFRSDSYFTLLKQIEGVGEMSAVALGGYSARLKGLQRYSALNCQAIAKLGTLEFRHMENAVDEITTKQVDFVKLCMLLKKLAKEQYTLGRHGEALFDYLKGLVPNELIRLLDFPLPQDGWDYPEALMLAIPLVSFKKAQAAKTEFSDMAFARFLGTHPRFR